MTGFTHSTLRRKSILTRRKILQISKHASLQRHKEGLNNNNYLELTATAFSAGEMCRLQQDGGQSLLTDKK